MPTSVGAPTQVLDRKGTNKVSATELKTVLTTLADQLSEAEYSKLMQITGVEPDGDDQLDYNVLYSQMQ